MKYLGSKNQIAKSIVPILQKCIDDNNITTYIEPFVGGANIIDKIECDNKIGSDTNKYLIALLNQLKKDPSLFPEELSREHYQDVKDDYKNNGTKYSDWYKGLVGFCGAFRGKFFDSCACYDYESQGKIRNNYKESLRNILKQRKNILDVNFLVSDYRKYEPSIYSNCLFYCDIPYKGTYNYNIEFDYESFYTWAKQISENNYIYISEYEMPNDFEMIYEQKKKMCLQSQSDRFVVTEKLFTYNRK